MTDFDLTKRNGEVWKFRGISVDAVDQVREALRRDNGNQILGLVPQLTDNEIKQISSNFWNNFVTYGINEPPQSIILKHPRTQDTIYTIQRPKNRTSKEQSSLPFGELVLKTPAPQLPPPEPPASNPEELEEDGAPIRAAQPQQPRTLGREVPNRSKAEPQPMRSREIRVIAKDDNKEEQVDNPDLPGGKKRKARKYTQRKKRNGPSRVFRHRASRVSTRKNKTSRK
jgi:type IV secretory pathway VirB10-like protein